MYRELLEAYIFANTKNIALEYKPSKITEFHKFSHNYYKLVCSQKGICFLHFSFLKTLPSSSSPNCLSFTLYLMEILTLAPPLLFAFSLLPNGRQMIVP